MSKKDEEVYIETITLDKIPLLAAITGKSEQSLKSAYYMAKSCSSYAWVLMSDPSKWR